MKPSIIFEKIAKGFMIASIVVVFIMVASIIYTIFKRGFGCITWEMVSSVPKGGFYIGGEGGFLNATVGSVYIVLASTVIGLIISIPIVFYLNVFKSQKSRLAYWVRLAFDILYGIPSIVYGAFAFSLMIYMGVRTSLLGGIIVITLLIIPILMRSMDEVAKNFPHDLLEASFSLGATRLDHRHSSQADSTRHCNCNIAFCWQGDWRRGGRDVYGGFFGFDSNVALATGGNVAIVDIFPTQRTSGRSAKPSIRRRTRIDNYRIGNKPVGKIYHQPFLKT